MFTTPPADPPWGRLLIAAAIAGAVGALVAWPLAALGAAVGLSTLMAEDTTAAEGYVASLMLAAGPFFVWVGFVPGIPAAAWMIRRGRAGWAMAAAFGAGIGLLAALAAGALAGPLSIATFAVIGTGAGLLYWITLRLVAPDVFAARPAAAG